jgi:tRNA threonylcarbamoyladenosine biosynthesis protein TsaE
VKIAVNTPEEMVKLGEDLAKYTQLKTTQLVLFLSGDLGAGKTTFVRGFLKGMGFNGAVKSPTYTLVEPYDFSNNSVYHFDFYRLKAKEALEDIGIRDYFHEKAYCLIEWPSKALDELPKPDILVNIEILGEARQLSVLARSSRGDEIVQDLQKS